MQVGRGIVATPESMIAPHKGKWWNEYESQWVLTNLPDEKIGLDGVPDDDGDILGKVEEEIENNCREGDFKQVQDTYYYDVLNVPPSADEELIKLRYFIMARQCHPLAVGPDDREAAEKFKTISEAYQVLGDPVIREEYDQKGMDGLSSDRSSSVVVERLDVACINAKILCIVLSGSEKFNDSIGRLSIATSASVRDSSKFSLDDARIIQKRRVTRLALKLVEKIHPWVLFQKSLVLVSSTADKVQLQAFESEWRQEALELCKDTYSHRLVRTIGKIYTLVGIMHEGSNEIGKRAARQNAKNEKKKVREQYQLDYVKAVCDMNKLHNDLQKKVSRAKTSQERKAINNEMHDEIAVSAFRFMWACVVLDVSFTTQETTMMVFFDRSVNRETRKLRAAAVKRMGEIWVDCSHGRALAEEHEEIYEGII